MGGQVHDEQCLLLVHLQVAREEVHEACLLRYNFVCGRLAVPPCPEVRDTFVFCSFEQLKP